MSGLRRVALLVGIAGWAAAGVTSAQARKKAAPANDRCRLQILNVDRQGVRTEPTPGVQNVFAGGNIHAQCVGRNIHIYSDSLASYGGNVVQFISQGNRVKYRDSTTNLDADFGTYFKDGERFEAQGNVVHRDLKNGSTISGARIDYLRPVRGLRTELEVLGYSRPTVSYVVKDSAGRAQAPYIIIGNTVRTVGSETINAGGAVTIDRENLKGSGDSLWLDTGKKQGGQLIGNAALRNQQDTAGTSPGFALTGRTIDLGLSNRELSSVKGRDSARLVSRDVTLDADSILIRLRQRQADQTVAWGKTVRPTAVSADYQVRGDSIWVETPNQKLSKVIAFGNGWAGLSGDTTTGARRDWIAGDKVTVTFLERAASGPNRLAIQQLQAEQRARSFYQVAPERGQTKGSMNYTRADRILVTMRITPDSNTVQQVDATGSVEGVHLQPAAAKRQDTTAVRPVPR